MKIVKKVGILNLQHTYNYGAVLQAYALESVIRKLGYEVETLDLKPNQGIKQKVKGLIKNIVNLGDIFEDFRRDNMVRSEKVKTLESNVLSKYNCLVVGSDQVWRVKFTSSNALSYFFENAPQSVDRISYAASFGVDIWESEFSNKDLDKRIRKELNNFKAISVRESSGVQICKDKFNVDAEHVLDPTLLAGRELFDKLTKSDFDKNKIVIYKLNSDKKFFEHVNKYAIDNNFIIDNIYNMRKYISVNSWVSKIKSAKLVITDSYHGVCFCLLFNKQFVCVVNKARGTARLESLLGSLGLSSRFVNCISEIDLNELDYIDYESVNKSLMKMREHSMQFLKHSLK
ncbi:Polysaccharide pyruvyl transferase family protein [Vibrio crassostreae]|uniref:polysaccharide pyruvyl transferase family protein n=1 Tax=Vibrio crassostreae TaxID=246167 RepID=UPI0010CE5762|nr:polysaccharide pyruvyl transferase family protein [Vibrio crassostreae]TCN85194.1 polysaccharide pyruvyl transferase [Vibrio crassostreae]CAK3029389.1 Polysaccharide pyruvyl transferase family protein [Vibrio crassostreae]